MTTPPSYPNRDPHDKPKPAFSDNTCGRGEDAPLFVNGTARGIRSFKVTDDGWLTGITYTQRWTTGENLARCLVTKGLPRDPGYVADDADTDDLEEQFENIIGGWGFKGDEITLLDHLVEATPCSGLDPECACGFYAYHTGMRHGYGGSSTAAAVIEGYGKVVLGPKGFRAQKARILAIVGPFAEMRLESVHSRIEIAALDAVVASMRNGCRWRTGQTTKMLAGLMSALGIAYAIHPWAFGAFALGLVATLTPICEAYIRKARREIVRKVEKLRDDRIRHLQARRFEAVEDAKALRELIAKNYPKIPLFESTEAMLDAFPTIDLGHLVTNPPPAQPGFRFPWMPNVANIPPTPGSST